MIAGYIVLCVAIICSLVLFGLSIWLLRTSMVLIAGYITSLMSNAERMLGSIEEQICVLRQQLEHDDMYIAMETGEMFDHEDDDE